MTNEIQTELTLAQRRYNMMHQVEHQRKVRLPAKAWSGIANRLAYVVQAAKLEGERAYFVMSRAHDAREQARFYKSTPDSNQLWG